MKKNVGTTDKIIRLLIAVAALYVAYTGMVDSPWHYVLYAVSAVMVLTSIMSYCPLFSVFGINSCKVKQS
ncbi:MAG: DUF2892 domain-containing protein [Flavobacteriaceae bacterium]|nr:DUF2892 domain-containing protein [Flavobacteriaceae bacterium]